VNDLFKESLRFTVITMKNFFSVFDLFTNKNFRVTLITRKFLLNKRVPNRKKKFEKHWVRKSGQLPNLAASLYKGSGKKCLFYALRKEADKTKKKKS
jgi:hypothetical protein